MNGPVIRLKNDEESLRKAAEKTADTLLEFVLALDALVKANIETSRKLTEEFCRITGKMLVLSIYERIDWTYPTNRSRGKKNTRLQRVARQGAAAAAARLSILSALRQKKWCANPGGPGGPYYTVGGWRRSLRSQKPAKSL